MKYIHFFQYNIPADNELNGHTDRYINIISEWDGKSFYTNDNPMIHVEPVNLRFNSCISVINWLQAYREIEKIAESHFKYIAKQVRLEQARIILAIEENAITER